MFLNIDYNLFNFINSFAGKSKIFDFIGIFCAKYLIFIIAGMIFGWWIELHKTKISSGWPILGKKKWLAFGNLSLSVLFALLLNYILGFIKFRERPFVNLNASRLVNPMSEKSFPSDHTAVVFAASMAVFFYDKKFGSVLLFLSLLVGFGRIYVGVHYPFDILGGILVGIFSAFFMRFLGFRKAG
jgi:undecaprenyl-diphosphatase